MHTTKACVVHCMDFRIQKTVGKLLENLGIHDGDFDRVSIAGGAANFEQLEKHLELSLKLHAPREIILTIHEDCGAGAKEEDLEKAAALAAEICPDYKIRSFFVNLNGAWEEK